LFTPGTSVNPAAATSAIPFAIGNVPDTPTAGAVQESNPPAQSAKLIIIDGVAPSADGLANNPSVAWVAASSVATDDRDTAAYNTLQPPLAIATIFPNVVAGPE
jgi:hypothetical protein